MLIGSRIKINLRKILLRDNKTQKKNTKVLLVFFYASESSIQFFLRNILAEIREVTECKHKITCLMVRVS